MNTKQLRQKILDLAIRGKLVPQDPNDEPASVLLERIRAEKEKLIKEGKIKRDKSDSRGDDKSHYENVPFELPESWVWCRLEDIFYFQGGLAYKSNLYVTDSENLVVRIGNVKNDNILVDASPVFISDDQAHLTKQYRICENDILFTMTGTRGKRDYFQSAVVKESDLGKKQLYLNQRVGCLRRIFDIDVNCICAFLKHSIILDEIFKTETGNVNQGNIGSNSTLQLLVPLPPLAEQRRIVAAIETAFAAIDEIERNKTGLQAAIAAAKNKILSLAIRGKLVPQDPNDEPASVLLKRIRAEREELIKAGKIKRDKNDSVIVKSDDNSYYEKLPQGWCMARLSSVADIVMGQSPSGELVTDKPDGVEFHQGKIYFTDRYLKHSGQYVSEANMVADKDSVLLCVRAPVGIVNITDRKIAIGRGLCAIKPLGGVSVDFIFYWLEAAQQSFVEQSTGTTFMAITSDVVRNQVVPIPPLPEQYRILEIIEHGEENLKRIAESLN